MNRRALTVIIITCIFLTFFTYYNGFSGDTAYDWPRWRGPNGDGISMETDWNPEALAGGPKILWKADIGSGYSNVAIEDNRLYTMGRKEGKNQVLCLNAKTGRKIWRYSFL